MFVRSGNLAISISMYLYDETGETDLLVTRWCSHLFEFCQ